MHTRIASLLLIASAVTQSFVCLLIASLVTPFFRSTYRLKSWEEAREFMPTITRLASDHSWFIAVLLAAVCVASLVALQRQPDSPIQCIVVGLCAQGLVTWAAMFSFCFEGFIGPMSLHHGKEFEFFQFASFGTGVFPVTLLLVAAPLISALLPRLISKQ
ncbi:MAG: hypothetical protein ABIV39_15865 [Verrucomicrobiota bacterium]